MDKDKVFSITLAELEAIVEGQYGDDSHPIRAGIRNRNDLTLRESVVLTRALRNLWRVQ